MTNVNVHPIPEAYRGLRFQPMPPPVFDGDPSLADVELAQALFLALDPESQRWYQGFRTFADLHR